MLGQVRTGLKAGKLLTLVSNGYKVYNVYNTQPTIGRTSSTAGLRSSEAYDSIRELILEGQLPQGSVVSEADLVRRLGMSRTPVREALRRLQAESYIWPMPGRGYAIPELNEADLSNLYTVRAVLEGLAAEHAAARLTRTDLARLEELYDSMEDARGRDDELARLNGEFHDAIAQASGNTYLQAMLSQIRDAFERFRMTALGQPGRREEAHAEHGQMISALRAGDAQRARDLATVHVHRALELRLRISDQHGDKGTK